MSGRLEGKVCVITGAGGGMGREAAVVFTGEGAKVCVADVSPTAAEETVGLCPEGSAFAFQVDVAREDGVSGMMAAAAERFGGIDVLYNNAGISPDDDASILDTTVDAWQRVQDVNTKGVFLCCQEAIARMRKHKRGGRLINTASGQARQGFVYTPHYAASKFGVVGITQSLAKEVAKEGITVNAFCPGIIDTDMWAYNDEAWGKLLGTYKPGELMAEWVRGIPMGRAGTGDDVAGLVTFLASDDAAYITGQTVNVDGGLIMS